MHSVLVSSAGMDAGLRYHNWLINMRMLKQRNAHLSLYADAGAWRGFNCHCLLRVGRPGRGHANDRASAATVLSHNPDQSVDRTAAYNGQPCFPARFRHILRTEAAISLMIDRIEGIGRSFEKRCDAARTNGKIWSRTLRALG
jgi:hypothetical protein